jgi:hypothetical protein
MRSVLQNWHLRQRKGRRSLQRAVVKDPLFGEALLRAWVALHQKETLLKIHKNFVIASRIKPFLFYSEKS